ncbi:MAG: hypothetical protein E8D52_11005 [Nitrospira sp.]|nr:MAG: hypothetical protein E8D52_11005 [Nitrospira sp.]
MLQDPVSDAHRVIQDSYEIVLDSTAHDVRRVWVRFGTLGKEAEEPTWDLLTGPFQLQTGLTKKQVIKIYDSQLPAPAVRCYYQLLCEIDDEHGEHETLMTTPRLLAETNGAL